MLRFIPTQLFRGHWRALSDYRVSPSAPDRTARSLVVGVPLLLGIIFFITNSQIAAPGALLSGVALLAGGFLSAFGQIASIRLRLTDRAERFSTVDQSSRDALDETTAHLLVASYMSAVSAFILVLGMNFGVDSAGRIQGIFAALGVASSAYVFMVFLIAIPRLYVAYTVINSVREELNGTHRR
jgi:ABC-type multidrug transport system fused ATPase/permease subunit